MRGTLHDPFPVSNREYDVIRRSFLGRSLFRVFLSFLKSAGGAFHFDQNRETLPQKIRGQDALVYGLPAIEEERGDGEPADGEDRQVAADLYMSDPKILLLDLATT